MSGIEKAINDIVLPLDWDEKYKEFVRKESMKMKRFLIDKDDLLYFSSGDGKAKEVIATSLPDMNRILDRLSLASLWEVAPDSYGIVSRRRNTQLVLRNELMNFGFKPKVLQLYSNLIEVRRALPEIPILITPEYAIPVLYNPALVPNLTHEPKYNILYSADGRRGVFSKVIDEVCILLATL